MWSDLREVSGEFKEMSSVSRCKQLVNAGRLSLACAALADAECVAPSTPATLEVLRAKNPTGPALVQPSNLPRHVPFSENDVERALRSFASGTGAGLSLLRPDHLKDLLTPIMRQPILQNIALVCDVIADNRALLDVQPFIAGAYLTPLLKKDAGIRPIACGDVMRRLVAKVFVFNANERIKTHFAPFQLGIGSARGLETIVHSWRELSARFAKDAARVGLKIDFQNAFNQIDRTVMLAELLLVFPEMARFGWFCYGAPAELVVRSSGDLIPNSMGAQQGCPLGPLLFCLVMQPLILLINREVPDLDLNRWYLDDGGLIGKSDDVRKAFDILHHHGPDRGLKMNLLKCQLVSFASSPEELKIFPESIYRYASSDFDILGSPIGSASFCSDFVDTQSLSKCRLVLSRLKLLNDPQSAYLLLRFCLSFCKMVHFMRTVPCGLLDRALAEFDQLVLSAFQELFPFPIERVHKAQIGLNIGFGGLGLRSTLLHQPAAFLSSVSAAIPSLNFPEGLELSPTGGFFDDAKDLMSLSKPANVSLDLPQSVPPQKVLSSFINLALQKELMNDLDDVGKARLNSCSARYASCWLSASPLAFLGQKFSPSEWNLSIAYRLGVPVVLEEESVCPLGGCAKPLGQLAHHAVRCGAGRDRSNRHDALRDFVFQQARVGQIAAQKEPPHLLQNCGLRPADVLLPNVAGGRSVCVDVAVTDPLQSKMVSGASRSVSFAANEYARVKHSKYSILMARKSDELVLWPVVVETLGAWSDDSLQLFDLLALWQSRRDSSISRASLRFSLLRRASCLIQRFNARMLINRT